MSNKNIMSKQIPIAVKSNTMFVSNVVYYRTKRTTNFMNRFVIVDYNSNKYVVMELRKTTGNVYTVFDYNDLSRVINIDGTWYFAKVGYSKNNDVYLHNFIMKHTPSGKGAKMSYDHLNRIKLDNRKSNLEYKSQTMQNINQSKKSSKNNIEKYPVKYKDIMFKNIPKWTGYERGEFKIKDDEEIEEKEEGKEEDKEENEDEKEKENERESDKDDNEEGKDEKTEEVKDEKKNNKEEEEIKPKIQHCVIVYATFPPHIILRKYKDKYKNELKGITDRFEMFKFLKSKGEDVINISQQDYDNHRKFKRKIQKKFTSMNEDDIPDLIKRANDYIKQFPLSKEFKDDYELYDKGKKLEKEYNDIIQIASIYL